MLRQLCIGTKSTEYINTFMILRKLLTIHRFIKWFEQKMR